MTAMWEELMGESGDQLQRTGSATPSPAQALTTEKVKIGKQAVPLYWPGHVLFFSTSTLILCPLTH